MFATPVLEDLYPECIVYKEHMQLKVDSPSKTWAKLLQKPLVRGPLCTVDP